MKTFVECIHGNKVEFDTNKNVGLDDRFSKIFANCCGIILEKRVRYCNDNDKVFVHAFLRNETVVVFLSTPNPTFSNTNRYDICNNTNLILSLENLDTPQKQFDALYKVYSNLEFL